MKASARSIVFTLVALAGMSPAADAASIQVDIMAIATPVCFGGATATGAWSTASYCGVTAAETPWSATVTVSGTFGSGLVFGSAELDTLADILGGTGSGFVNVIYTDTILLGHAYWGSFVEQASAGALWLQNYDLPAYAPVSFSSTHSSGFIPITFGDAVPVNAFATVTAGLEQSGWNATVSETVTFDIRDGDMTVLPGAYAAVVPEPATVWLIGAAVVLLAIEERARFRPAARSGR